MLKKIRKNFYYYGEAQKKVAMCFVRARKHTMTFHRKRHNLYMFRGRFYAFCEHMCDALIQTRFCTCVLAQDVQYTHTSQNIALSLWEQDNEKFMGISVAVILLLFIIRRNNNIFYCYFKKWFSQAICSATSTCLLQVWKENSIGSESRIANEKELN